MTDVKVVYKVRGVLHSASMRLTDAREDCILYKEGKCTLGGHSTRCDLDKTGCSNAHPEVTLATSAERMFDH